MVHLQLFRSYQPVSVIKPYRIDAEKVEKWYPVYPAVTEKVTHGYHSQRCIHICQHVYPDDAVAVKLRVYYHSPRIMTVVPHAIPMTEHQQHGCPLRQHLVVPPYLPVHQTVYYPLSVFF